MQKLGSFPIRLRLYRVLTAIKLHYEVPLEATKIGYIPPDYVLTPELGPVQLPSPQPPPQCTLRISLVATQTSGALL